ncbi:radical SAM protein [Eubacterium pyruvativorans]|uniref:radical SAM protein n=1 Tax=Eubacterium pyruvativorans TaxID=155865 RepID=UPI0024096143|nr:radical SAM protein [Eubacterium pyruvativorans]MDD6708370.1 radical SAM protein [Eubacterium pyruvativorans]MDY4048934.1 radical SAM protein [Eubacterium pyruvativorans]
MSVNLTVNEIFGSIDGEGLTAGGLACFIRLAGCNLRCSYCDTGYALEAGDGREMTIPEILAKVRRIGYRHVTLTGGEPLIHPGAEELIDALLEEGHLVNIETNGSVPVRPYQKPGVMITMDWKCPGSGMEEAMLPENPELLREGDVLKFVCEASDFDEVRRVLEEHSLRCWVYLSPVFGKVRPEQLVDFLKSLADSGMDTEKIRVQVQLHKVIWDPEERGV